jgi:DNA-binding CsgD family transcriptional regulator
VTPPDYIGNRFAPYARAWVATLAGKPAEAASVLAQAAEVARRSSEWTGWFEAWHEAARLGVLDPMRVALFDEGPEPGGRLSAARAGFVRGLARQDAALLADSARRFRECGALLFAAEAAQAAASALRVSGRPREAAEADALAAALRADVPAANTPLLGGRRSASGVLTSRELEIATLAASGLSNRAIAERLVVSERTIENHLYRVFIKLGVSGRDQLSSALLTH